MRCRGLLGTKLKVADFQYMLLVQFLILAG